jgi:serine hydrolase
MLDSHAATPILIVPGLGGSGPDHWQSRWQLAHPTARRVEQADWNRPVRARWLHRLAEAVRDTPGAILVGHSLGCALIAHLAWQHPHLPISGALLVAPADVDDHAAAELREFAPMPLVPLPFRSVLVASSNDPYMTIERARMLSQAWGARFVSAGACGHINVAAGFGPWQAGAQLLAELLHECRTSGARTGLRAAG